MWKSDARSGADRMERGRRWVNANPAIVMVACIACMLVLMAVVHSEQKATTPSSPTHEWFYDTMTGELVPQACGTLPPVKFGSGELWRARVFTCGGCEESFIGYYAKLTPEAKQRLDELEAIRQTRPLSGDEESEAYDIHMSGWLCSVDGKQWRPRDFQVEEELALMIEKRCPEARPCWPGRHDLR